MPEVLTAILRGRRLVVLEAAGRGADWALLGIVRRSGARLKWRAVSQKRQQCRRGSGSLCRYGLLLVGSREHLQRSSMQWRCGLAALGKRDHGAGEPLQLVRAALFDIDRKRRAHVFGAFEETAPPTHVQVIAKRDADRTAHREYLFEQAAQHDQCMRRTAHLTEREPRQRARGCKWLDADELCPEQLGRAGRNRGRDA